MASRISREGPLRANDAPIRGFIRRTPFALVKAGALRDALMAYSDTVIIHCILKRGDAFHSDRPLCAYRTFFRS